jgi:acyl CoA:acetate/3-ketoacid CoA transferase beta subunit
MSSDPPTTPPETLVPDPTVSSARRVVAILGAGGALGAAISSRLAAEPDTDLVLSDGEAYLTDGETVEGWLPYRDVFRLVAAGRRHVMMGASQLDRHGNQNISCVGDWARPSRQLLGVRGAPGNTVNHTTSYWIPRHSTRVLVEHVDMVSGIGYDRAAALGPPGNRFHEIRRVVTNLAVLDFETPDHSMRLRSIHPGVPLDEVLAATGFPLSIPDEVPQTRSPSAEELALIRDRLDPAELRDREIP